MKTIKQQTFCGREFTGEEISLIQEVVATCGGISRRELAHTMCELEWISRSSLILSMSLNTCGKLAGPFIPNPTLNLKNGFSIGCLKYLKAKPFKIFHTSVVIWPSAC